MNASRKFAGFVLALVAIFAAAMWIGALIKPKVDAAPTHGAQHTTDSGQEQPGPSHEHSTPATADAGGLTASADGYTLELSSSQVAADTNAPVQFRIVDSKGTPVTRYTDEHEKPLHLIVVRRDLAGFQHVHPTLDGSGTWSAMLRFSGGGDYRVFADFIPEGGDGVTLGADLRVAGTYDPRTLPAANSSTMVDGYTITLNGDLEPGRMSHLTFSVSRDGLPVTELQPYLGAYGHLVALRTADLGYLHVHPDGHPGDGTTTAGPDIDFATTAPSAGDYRLFLDFQHAGVVHTAEFTVTTGRERE